MLCFGGKCCYTIAGSPSLHRKTYGKENESVQVCEVLCSFVTCSVGAYIVGCKRGLTPVTAIQSTECQVKKLPRDHREPGLRSIMFVLSIFLVVVRTSEGLQPCRRIFWNVVLARMQASAMTFLSTGSGDSGCDVQAYHSREGNQWPDGACKEPPWIRQVLTRDPENVSISAPKLNFVC